MNNTLKITTIACPNCGADVGIPKHTDIAVCTYCGSEIIPGYNLNFLDLKISESQKQVDSINKAIKENFETREFYKIESEKTPDTKMEGCELSSYCGTASNIEIPSYVRKIREHSFKNCQNVTNIRIPDSVIVIEDNAFSGIRDKVLIHAKAGSCAAKYAHSHHIQLKEYDSTPDSDDIRNTCLEVVKMRENMTKIKYSGVIKIINHYNYVLKHSETVKERITENKSSTRVGINVTIIITMILALCYEGYTFFFILIGIFIIVNLRYEFKENPPVNDKASHIEKAINKKYSVIFKWNNAFNESFSDNYLKYPDALPYDFWNYPLDLIKKDLACLKKSFQQINKTNTKRILLIKQDPNETTIDSGLIMPRQHENYMIEKILYNFRKTIHYKRNLSYDDTYSVRFRATNNLDEATHQTLRDFTGLEIKSNQNTKIRKHLTNYEADLLVAQLKPVLKNDIAIQKGSDIFTLGQYNNN